MNYGGYDPNKIKYRAPGVSKKKPEEKKGALETVGGWFQKDRTTKSEDAINKWRDDWFGHTKDDTWFTKGLKTAGDWTAGTIGSIGGMGVDAVRGDLLGHEGYDRDWNATDLVTAASVIPVGRLASLGVKGLKGAPGALGGAGGKFAKYQGFGPKATGRATSNPKMQAHAARQAGAGTGAFGKGGNPNMLGSSVAEGTEQAAKKGGWGKTALKGGATLGGIGFVAGQFMGDDEELENAPQNPGHGMTTDQRNSDRIGREMEEGNAPAGGPTPDQIQREQTRATLNDPSATAAQKAMEHRRINMNAKDLAQEEYMRNAARRQEMTDFKAQTVMDHLEKTGGMDKYKQAYDTTGGRQAGAWDALNPGQKQQMIRNFNIKQSHANDERDRMDALQQRMTQQWLDSGDAAAGKPQPMLGGQADNNFFDTGGMTNQQFSDATGMRNQGTGMIDRNLDGTGGVTTIETGKAFDNAGGMDTARQVLTGESDDPAYADPYGGGSGFLMDPNRNAEIPQHVRDRVRAKYGLANPAGQTGPAGQPGPAGPAGAPPAMPIDEWEKGPPPPGGQPEAGLDSNSSAPPPPAPPAPGPQAPAPPAPGPQAPTPPAPPAPGPQAPAPGPAGQDPDDPYDQGPAPAPIAGGDAIYSHLQQYGPGSGLRPEEANSASGKGMYTDQFGGQHRMNEGTVRIGSDDQNYPDMGFQSRADALKYLNRGTPEYVSDTPPEAPAAPAPEEPAPDPNAPYTPEGNRPWTPDGTGTAAILGGGLTAAALARAILSRGKDKKALSTLAQSATKTGGKAKPKYTGGTPESVGRAKRTPQSGAAREQAGKAKDGIKTAPPPAAHVPGRGASGASPASASAAPKANLTTPAPAGRTPGGRDSSLGRAKPRVQGTRPAKGKKSTTPKKGKKSTTPKKDNIRKPSGRMSPRNPGSTAGRKKSLKKPGKSSSSRNRKGRKELSDAQKAARDRKPDPSPRGPGDPPSTKSASVALPIPSSVNKNADLFTGGMKSNERFVKDGRILSHRNMGPNRAMMDQFKSVNTMKEVAKAKPKAKAKPNPWTTARKSKPKKSSKPKKTVSNPAGQSKKYSSKKHTKAGTARKSKWEKKRDQRRKNR